MTLQLIGQRFSSYCQEALHARGIVTFKASLWIVVATAAAMTPAAAGAADRYAIDSEHTYPSVEFSHMGLSTWRGKFNRTSGQIILDRAARSGSVDVVVDTSSINFGLERMDAKARGKEAFNVLKFPAATYRGKLQFVGDEAKSVEGELTLLGVTHPLTLSIDSLRCMPHPMTHKEVCGADAVGELDWKDFGMGIGRSGMTHVRLQIQVEAVRQD
jgi:polyisoprenoid-binding protein YceI